MLSENERQSHYFSVNQYKNVRISQTLFCTQAGSAVAMGTLKCFINIYRGKYCLCSRGDQVCCVWYEPAMTGLDIYSDRQESHQPLQPGSSTHILLSVPGTTWKLQAPFVTWKPGLSPLGMLIWGSVLIDKAWWFTCIILLRFSWTLEVLSGKMCWVLLWDAADGLQQLTKTQNMHFPELGCLVKIACQILLSGDMWS